MKATFLKLAGSMKFWTTLLAIIAHIGVKYGLEMSLETQLMVAGFFAMLLGGQALQDQGKEAAKINANLHSSLQANSFAANDNAHAVVGLSGVVVTVTNGDAENVDDEMLAAFGWMKKPKDTNTNKPAAGMAAGVIGLLVAVVMLSACSWWSKGGGKETTLNCASKNASALTTEFGNLFELAVVRATGGDGEVDYNSLKSATASFITGSGTCVAINTLAKLKNAKVAKPGEVVLSAGVNINDESIDAGIAMFSGGKPVKTLYDGAN